MKIIKRPQKFLISGAGIAGLSLARRLEQQGIPFKLIERRSCLPTEGAGIALPANAVKALRYLGLGDEIDSHAHRVKKIIYTQPSGEILSEASLLEPPLNVDDFVALPRSELHEILATGVKSDICFNTSIDLIAPNDDGYVVKFDNPDVPQEEYTAIVAADGLYSRVRELMMPNFSLIDFGVTNWRWICEYPTDDLQPTYMLGAENVFLAYPIAKSKVYCWTQVYDPDQQLFKQHNRNEILLNNFADYGGIAQEMLKILPDDEYIIPNRLNSLPKPIYTKDRAVFVGDAGNPCSPMLQQGAACALEDVISLAALIGEFSVGDALRHYEVFRKKRVDWIVESSNKSMEFLIESKAEEVLVKRNAAIRSNGPFNIQGWKKLLMEDPLTDLPKYIEQQAATNVAKYLF